MDSEEIIKLLGILVGSVEAVGSSHVDNQIYDNLSKLLDVMDWGIDRILGASMTADRPEYSMARIGNRAKDFLCEFGKMLKAYGY